jgi:hypothetical protein
MWEYQCRQEQLILIYIHLNVEETGSAHEIELSEHLQTVISRSIPFFKFYLFILLFEMASIFIYSSCWPMLSFLAL